MFCSIVGGFPLGGTTSDGEWLLVPLCRPAEQSAQWREAYAELSTMPRSDAFARLRLASLGASAAGSSVCPVRSLARVQVLRVPEVSSFSNVILEMVALLLGQREVIKVAMQASQPSPSFLPPGYCVINDDCSDSEQVCTVSCVSFCDQTSSVGSAALGSEGIACATDKPRLSNDHSHWF